MGETVGMCKLDLLPSERGRFFCATPAISTVTFFELTPDDVQSHRKGGENINNNEKRKAMNAVIQYFKNKVDAILDANPWLRSDLRYDANKDMAAYYPESRQMDKKQYFELRNDISLNYPECLYRYEEIGRLLKPTLCKSSDDAIGRSAPLFKVTLVPCCSRKEKESDDDEEEEEEEDGKCSPHQSNQDYSHVALVLSGNHSLLDGYSLYMLYNMLSIDQPIRSLNATRKQEIPDKIIKALKSEKSFVDEANTGFIIKYIFKSMLNKFFFPQAESRIFYINETWVHDAKKKTLASISDNEGESVSPVSTNDVLVSEISKGMQNDGSDLEVIMAVNFRNRIENCTNDDVGNYENCITYKAADFATASLIRKSLSGEYYFRASKPVTKRWSIFEAFWGKSKIGLLSNWSKFPVTLKLHDNVAKEVLHLPLFDNSGAPVSVANGAVIFRPTANKTALFIFGDKAFVEYVNDAEFVEKPCIAESSRAV